MDALGNNPSAAATRTCQAPPAGVPAVRLVAVDLDGTLLNDSKQVSDQTVAAFPELQRLPDGV